jgi:arabinogalactan endo-1,4-beta-galactosidase
MKINFFKYVLSALFSVIALTACSDNDNVVPQTEPTYDMTGFAKGADVGWLTEMEASGVKFYDDNGKETECLKLLRSLGVNSIRMRVWVNPSDGWNGKEDVIAKAWRAKQLGFRIMIDFHYSDTWADPSKQTIPAAWQNYDLEQMKTAVASHTTEVLQALKDKDIDVEWVQVGNETTTGMLWPMGDATKSMSNYAQLELSGYNAVKAVYPNAKVIVHVDEGNKLGKFTWLFDGLKENGGKWDVIGMSLYPDDTNWETLTKDCINNINTLKERYNTEVVISEIGMPWDSENAEAAMTKMVSGCKAIDGCLGVFYWEPECYNQWKDYTKGAFDNNGKPTSVFNAFK